MGSEVTGVKMGTSQGGGEGQWLFPEETAALRARGGAEGWGAMEEGVTGGYVTGPVRRAYMQLGASRADSGLAWPCAGREDPRWCALALHFVTILRRYEEWEQMSTLPPDLGVHAAGQRSQSGTELISSAYTGFAVTQEGRTASFSSQWVSLGNSTSSHTEAPGPPKRNSGCGYWAKGRSLS